MGIEPIYDSNGKDTQHIDHMVKVLRKLKYVNAFLIMFNSENPHRIRAIVHESNT